MRTMDGTGNPEPDRRSGVAPAAGPALVVVTGAGGFVGRHVVAALTAAGLRVRAVTRRAAADAVQSPAGAGPRADAATVAASVTAAGVTAA
ncbi:MAG: NAD-dependent epimerase/dehydratase family protein, partial [Lautropia sp.]